MLGSIFTALSGMNAFSQALQTISNNVANMNSLGYKAQKVSFTGLYNQGGTGGGLSYTADAGKVVGGGVRFNDPLTDFSQGNLQESTGSLDLAIEGVGFLTLKDGANTLYTRTGQFAVDKDGYVTLQGTDYRLAVLDGSNQPVAANVDISRTNTPVATTSVTFAYNLSSTATTAGVPNISVYDSNGRQHAWNVNLVPAGADSPNQWTVTVTDETGATIKTSTLSFTGGAASPATAQITVDATPAGAAPMSVVLDFSKVTSYSGATSTLSTSKVDGHPSGDLSAVTVDDTGKVLLTYSNGEKVQLGSVALADFRDPQQLTQIGANIYKYNGTAALQYVQSGQNGVGELQSKQLEASNVSLTTEFGQLILVQRGFQASSQVVSVSNDMIQQLFGMRGQ